MSPYTFVLALAIVTLAAARVASGESPVLYSVINTANNTVGGARFDTQIGSKLAKQTMYAATRSTWGVFNYDEDHTNGSDRKKINSISLFIDDIKPAKDASIHLNANFIGNYTGNLRRQFNGIIYEKVACIWQWDARGQAPEGLITGIAHYVRLQARYGTEEKVKPGEGERWDQGNGVTARFLTYCNQLKRGFVGELNKKMKYGYTDGFFVDLLGMTVDRVWSNYKAEFHK
ncbi:hypothetical protein LINPERPRIM_LOCUS26434 [Linum perenne]